MNQNLLPRIAFVCFLASLPLGCQNATPSSNDLSRASNPDAKKVDQEVKLVAVKVTGMMCPHSCLKDVKSLIELTKQQNEETIDNPVVLVRYRGVLNEEATTKAILAAGFEKVEYSESESFPN
jgi:copper chaperone CopZ